MNLETRSKLLPILQLTCFLLFLGRAWQHLVWDAPFRTLLWDEAWMTGVVHFFTGMSWQEYAGSEEMDRTIQYVIKGFGAFYLICSVIVFFVKKELKWTGVIMIASSSCFFFLALLYWKEKFFQPAQLLEYTAQFISPILLYLLTFNRLSEQRFIFIVKIAVAITFISHGLYAIGYYPQPGEFVDMFINIFGLSEPIARLILKIAGVLDFVISIGIFIPNLKIQIPFIVYAIVWGGVTALARLVANFYIDFFWQSLNQNVYEVFYRIPHACLPLLIFVYLRHWSSSPTSGVLHQQAH